MSQVFGPYEPIRKAGKTYFVSGQVGVDPKTKQAMATFTDQMHQCMKNMVNALSLEKLSLQDVVNIRVYLVDMQRFNDMNDIFINYSNGIGPSRECVGVAALPDVGGNEPLQIEISAIAYKNNL